MNGFRISALLALVLFLTAAAIGAPNDPAPLYEYAAKYTYWSDLSDGVYQWAVRNESTTATLTGWTTGSDVPIDAIPRAAIIPEAVFPLPTVQPSLPRPWFNAFLSSDLAPVTVESTLSWSDGTSTMVPIYMPLSALRQELRLRYVITPEPSGLLALALGIGGVVMGLRRKLG